ncbi:MAG: type VI secretion system baseplate subunit TssK [Planctomycetaceae bacterium]
MTNFPIHWHEGQFLRPHHFQWANRYLESLIQLESRSNSIFNFGLSAIEIDEDALLNWRFSLRRCQLKTIDGTIIRHPDDVNLPPLQLNSEKDFNNHQRRARIYLAIPRLDYGRSNSASEAEAGVTHRYIVDTTMVDDENLANNKQPLQLRRHNARLIVGEDAASRYEALPICQLRLGTTDVATPEIDPDYIPPVLSVAAWPLFRSQMLTSIRDRYQGLADELSREFRDRGVAFLAERSEDLERILKLQAINSVLGGVNYLCTIGRIHPLTAYLELSRCVGTMSIFKIPRSLPPLPEYDHDELGPCFIELKRLLDMGPEERPSYFPRDFKGAGYQLQVRLDREWLEPSWNFYIGVKSNLTLNEVDRLLRTRLHLKAGASDEVEQFYLRAISGVTLEPAPSPPLQLPSGKQGWTYWLVKRESAAWRHVEDTLHFAIRFNEKQAKSTIEGQKSVTVQNPEDLDLVELAFTLYAVPAK